MPIKKSKSVKSKKFKERINKQNAWLKYFLTEGAHTFLNKSESARAAGYAYANEDCLRTTGCRLFRKHTDIITKWFDEVGLSENALKNKLLSLIEAKETRFFQHEGFVTDERKVEALEIQRKTLDMAIKIRGMYAPTTHIVDPSDDLMNVLKEINGVTRGLPTKS